MNDPSLWICLGFILFCGLTFKPARRLILKALDQYINSVRTKIDGATALRDKSQQDLLICQQTQAQILQQIDMMNIHATFEVTRLMQQSQIDMQNYFAQEEQQFHQRMHSRERRMIKSIEQQIVSIAISTCQHLLQQPPLNDHQQAITDQMITDLEHADSVPVIN